MRDLRLALPFGSQPTRKFFLFALAMLMALFALATTASQAGAQAATATWSGSTLNYNDHQYVPIGKAKPGDSHGIKEGYSLYTYIEPAPGGDESATRKAYIIYFAPGVDPPKEKEAGHATFTYASGKFSDRSDVKTISVTPDPSGGKGGTSCNIPGIGWIICPVSNFLAKAMDWIFNVLAGFLRVEPLKTTQDDALFTAWSVMRNFANVAFVIAFLVLIYSQVTNLGISNYGIKKLLPRLIIAAILVNISYWICAIAVDASNIMGYSLQNILMNIRENMTGASNSDVISWESLTGAALGTGTLATAGFLKLATIGSLSGAIYMLLPILVGVLIAALVALLIMAARQALIVILIMIAPLAFVAYLLPNTEKYFEKWRGIFTTMLMLFPVFAVIFGGSQIAGAAILQNASSVIMVILGMATQVAPLVVLPFLLKFSGSLLGRVAGIANDKTKGLIDQTRQMAQDKADVQRSKKLAKPNVLNHRRNRLFKPLAYSVQKRDHNKREREGTIKANEALAENRWLASNAFHNIDTKARQAERAKHILEQQHDKAWNIKARIDPNSIKEELKLRVATDEASVAKARLESMHEDFKAGSGPVYGPQTASMAALLDRSTDATRDLALTSMRKHAAERTQKSQVTDALLKNTAKIDGELLRDYAGGIRGIEGANSVLASSVAAYREEYGKMVAEKTQLLKHFNLSSNKRQDLAMGTNVDVEKNGVKYTFKADDEYAREAAIEEQLKTGSEGQIIEIIRESGAIKDSNGNVLVKGKTYDYRTTISAAIPSNGIPGKALIFGSKSINDVGQGDLLGEEGLNNAAVYHIMDGKIRDDVLAVQGASTLQLLFESFANRHNIPQYVNASAAKQAEFDQNYQALRESAGKILDDPVNRNSSEAARKVFEKYRT